MPVARLRALFDRYAMAHQRATHPGYPLPLPDGALAGYVDGVEQRGTTLRFYGWTVATALTLVGPAERIPVRPAIDREDVRSIPAYRDGRGFEVEVPESAGPFQIELALADGRIVTHPARVPGPLQVGAARARLRLTFARDLARATPLILRWLVTRDLRLRRPIRERLGLFMLPAAGRLDGAILGDAPIPPDPDRYTIILPIYNAFDVLQEALTRVVAHSDGDWHLIAIDDCSTDAQVRPWLAAWQAQLAPEMAARVTLLHNDRNLGFIGTVNRGFALALQRPGHVVLLNSDALLPAGWAGRLIGPMLGDPSIATVTPMTNDGEIFNAPVLCRRRVLRPGEAEAADAAIATGAGALPVFEGPTGVGFCMAMNRTFLARTPRFDPIFGRGYGEEVDWCQIVRDHDGRHVGTPRLFVEHRGGESFGSAEKVALIKANGQRISSRYPAYDAEVQRFIAADPGLTGRLLAGLALAGARAGGAVPVYVGHSMGGGAENWLADRIAADLGQAGAAVVLRVGGRMRWRVELHVAEGVTQGDTDDEAVVARLMAALPARHLVYSCAVGDQDPAGLPDVLLSLLTGPDDRVSVLFHDWFPISPSYCLLGDGGVFAGVPGPGSDETAHTHRRPGGERIGVAEWQAAWGRLIDRAEEAVVFAEDGGAHVRAVWPGARLRVAPHGMTRIPPRLAPPPGADRVAILGNIGLQKGAALIAPLARALAAEGGPQLMVLGNVDPAYGPPEGVVAHGTYRLDDLPALVARYGIRGWIIPSVWPETFSYTTHEALATGLPVWGFALGAQGEALARAPNGHAVPWRLEADLAADLAAAILDRAAG